MSARPDPEPFLCVLALPSIVSATSSTRRPSTPAGFQGKHMPTHTAVDMGNRAPQRRGASMLSPLRGLTRTALERTVFQLVTQRVPGADHSLRQIGDYIRVAVSRDQRSAAAP